jgi:DNA modification methylase
MSRHTDRLEIISIDKLIPYANNARTHSDEQIKKIQASLREFGFVNPVLIDKDCGIIAGHARVEAAKREGLTEVPCVWVEHLTEAQKKAYILADNRLAEDAGWDFELLSVELEELKELDFDIGLTGFGADELSDIFGEEELEAVEDDYEVELPEEPKTKLGDVYQLGRHRLMCGDSTDKATVETLMDGNKADMVFTDPPYNIGYQGVRDKRTIQNDKMTDEDFVDFLEKALMPCETMYVCCSWQYSHLFRQALENIGQKIKAMIVWDKVNPAQHLDKYFKQHEIIWYCGAFGGEKTLRGDVWQCKRQKNTVHPTMKPLELIGMALQDQPKKKIVYDGFGGSGSTLIACEQLDRTCYMMELDPKYCDVIVKRWETLTGQKAVLLNG